MASIRQQNSLTPPPSPIPTGKGLRSSAVNDQILSDYLQKSVQIPKLKLPDSHSPKTPHQSIPDEVDYGSLVSRGGDSVAQLLGSASEIGVFRISGHGMSAEELRSMVPEAELLFQKSDGIGRKMEFRRNGRNQEEFVWSRSEKERRTLSPHMESVAFKLETIANEISQVFSEYLSKSMHKKVKETESILSLIKYNHDNLINLDQPLSNKNNSKSSDHALSLHLPMKQCKYYVQTKSSHLFFEAGPNTIVVGVGEQLKDWSQGEFKSVSGEWIFEPDLHSFSVVFKCSLSSLIHDFNITNNKRFSIMNQFLIALVLIFLYKICTFLSS